MNDEARRQLEQEIEAAMGTAEFPKEQMLVLADLLEEAGNLPLARAYRWSAERKEPVRKFVPLNNMPVHWYWLESIFPRHVYDAMVPQNLNCGDRCCFASFAQAMDMLAANLGKAPHE